MEGSLTRRSRWTLFWGGTTTGGVVPDRPRTVSTWTGSESETAFLVKYDEPNARTALRRPGAEHRARPGPPDDTLINYQTVPLYATNRPLARLAGGHKKRVARSNSNNPSPSGRGVYSKTWDMEGSLTRRPAQYRVRGGTTTGGVVPDRPAPGIAQAGSESETAFLVKYGKPYARTAQRRPGAEHQARPGPPEDASIKSTVWFVRYQSPIGKVGRMSFSELLGETLATPSGIFQDRVLTRLSLAPIVNAPLE
jgi:hypothetical protein